MFLNINKIDKLVEEGFISRKKHPTLDLYIHNYTQKTQWEKHWTKETKHCRGLILDASHNVVARPFPKFFNMEELEGLGIPIPSLPFEACVKMDGSLGILYPTDNGYQVATRGSFKSEQAIWATEKLRDYDLNLNPSYTYLVEIIYPSNRIVLDYGDTEELKLIAVIDNDSGEDIPLYDVGLPIVYKLNYSSNNELAKMKAEDIDNEEGYVLKYENGFRMKVKFATYFRLHKLLTCMSENNIWEAMMNGDNLDDMIRDVPDEFYDWFNKVRDKILWDYANVVEFCAFDFENRPVTDDRKELALYFKTRTYPHILFKMLDEQEWEHYIWKAIKPNSTDVYTGGAN